MPLESVILINDYDLTKRILSDIYYSAKLCSVTRVYYIMYLYVCTVYVSNSSW